MGKLAMGKLNVKKIKLGKGKLPGLALTKVVKSRLSNNPKVPLPARTIGKELKLVLASKPLGRMLENSSLEV